MTNEEFNELTRQAWKKYPLITAEVRAELLDTYKNASKLVEAEVLRAERLGLSELTIDSKNSINRQLDRGVAMIAPATDEAISSGITRTIDIEDDITNAFINQGVVTFNMNPLNVAVREEVLTLAITRQFSDGYTLSERIWESASLYKTDMSRVINLGLAQGKDNIKIAQALSGYIKNGRESLIRAKTYGKIKQGNGALYSRISQNTDYRALRLIRSEEYMSLQASQVLRAKNNPAATGLYNWVKNSFTAHECECQSLQDGSPYTEDKIPSYPHPNCMCTISPILMDSEQFIEDLKNWNNGGSVPYLDKWYNDVYLLRS